jgi:two-component system, cell cycle sensor histidine kinase and response regulator CckA
LPAGSECQEDGTLPDVGELIMTESALSAAYRGTETILLVEDEAPVRRGIRRLLEWAGYQVLTACDADEAFGLAADYTIPIHLLLTDFVLPRTNGYELADAIQATRPSLRVVFMSGYSEGELPQAVDRTGAGFLQKPFAADALLSQLREVLHPLRRQTDAVG